MRHQNWIAGLLGVAVLLLAGCGTSLGNGDNRSNLGVGGNDGTGGANDTTVQSSGAITCSVTPETTLVTTGQPFQLSVVVSGNSGLITIDGTSIQNATGNTFTMSATMNNDSGVNVIVTSKVTVQDQSGNWATCSYKVTVN